VQPRLPPLAPPIGLAHERKGRNHPFQVCFPFQVFFPFQICSLNCGIRSYFSIFDLIPLGLDGWAFEGFVGLAQEARLHFLGPCSPSQVVGRLVAFRNLLETFGQTPKLFPNPESNFPYMNLILRTITNLLVIYGIQSKTPNNILSPYHIPYLLKQHRTLSVSTYGL
jgi:hypothetical protein